MHIELSVMFTNGTISTYLIRVQSMEEVEEIIGRVEYAIANKEVANFLPYNPDKSENRFGLSHSIAFDAVVSATIVGIHDE